MSTLLDLPEIRRRSFRVTVEDYRRLAAGNKRTELLRGNIISKLPKSPLHSSMIRRLLKSISRQLPNHLELQSEQPVTAADDSEPEPDVAVVPASPDEYRQAHPVTAELIAEVAVTSEEEDRAKISIYAEAGVKEYWLVLPRASAVEVFRRPVDGSYAEQLRIESPAVLESSAVPGLRVELEALFR